MGGTLIVWKAPQPDDEGDAARLLAGYYATGDESAFDPSPDVTAFYREVLALWPAPEPAEDGDANTPAWSSAPERSDRVVSLDYSWSASDALLDEIERLARRHKLVLYDRQGPHVEVPGRLTTVHTIDAQQGRAVDRAAAA